MSERDRPRISIEDEDGRCVAEADIEVVSRSEVRASLHVEPGHLPRGTRARLVDAVLDTPEVSSCGHVQVALPLGDTEILDRVRERCDLEEVRAAGATCLVEAELAGGPAVESGADAGEEGSSG
jgi:hypothetical protein